MNSTALTAELPCATSTPIEQGVLLTLAYSDLFDYPLTQAELGCYLPVACTSDELERTLQDLAPYLGFRDGFWYLRGREEIVAQRRDRAELAAGRWRSAHRFASWLARVPFLRMVAVCGSQAVENGDAEGDVDLFLITEPGRLWLVQAITMVLRRLGQLVYGIEICPNYLTTRDRLEVERRNLYIAREIAQTVPLWGEDDYERFLAANRWVERFFPRLDLADRRSRLEPRSHPRWTRALERLLGGFLGHTADRLIHRTLLLYYRLRLRGRGWRKGEIEGAYQADRQALITGGYAGAVAHRFFERAREALGAAGCEASTEELQRFFLGLDDENRAESRESVEADPHFAGIFSERYGKGRPGEGR